jgi:hypothetical protein
MNTLLSLHRLKNRNLNIIFILILVLFISCKKDKPFGPVEPAETTPTFMKHGLWVVNEGIFGQANGELSFISLSENKVYNNVFRSANEIYAGDIPLCMTFNNDKAILTVNNSSKIYILNRNDFKISNTISVLSPRMIVAINDSIFAISSFANEILYFLTLHNTSYKLDSLHLGKSSEKILVKDNFLYALNWSAYGGNYENNTLQIINITHKKLEKTIQLTKEPNSMALDLSDNLWVLCSGGFMNEEKPKLYNINTKTKNIIQSFEFPEISSSPFALSINKQGTELYFINNHVYKMNIDDTELPTKPFIEANQRTFYALHADIIENKIIVNDVKNYQVNGNILLFNLDGTLHKQYEVGINPGVVVDNP